MNKYLIILAVLCFTVAVITHFGTSAQPVSENSSDGSQLIWPNPPAQPRLKFVRTFSSPEDLGIGRSFFQQLKSLISGYTQARLVRPMAVVESADNKLFIADPGARGVHRFDVQGSAHVLIQSSAGPLPSPVALAAGPLGEVYVSDSRLRHVFVIEPGSDIAHPAQLEIPLSQPAGLAVDSMNGQLYLVDTGAHNVKIFARDGALLNEFGGRGGDPGKFNYPTMIWQNSSRQLLITDSLNFRIQVFDTGGRFVNQFGKIGDSQGYLAQPKGIAADNNGHIYVVDSLLHRLQLFDAHGSFLLRVGHRGINKGEFWLPAGIFINKEDMVYLADSYNGRVQVFQYIGSETP